MAKQKFILAIFKPKMIPYQRYFCVNLQCQKDHHQRHTDAWDDDNNCLLQWRVIKLRSNTKRRWYSWDFRHSCRGHLRILHWKRWGMLTANIKMIRWAGERRGLCVASPTSQFKVWKRSVVQGCGYGAVFPNQMRFGTLSCRLMQVGRKRHTLQEGCRDDWRDSCTWISTCFISPEHRQLSRSLMDTGTFEGETFDYQGMWVITFHSPSVNRKP